VRESESERVSEKECVCAFASERDLATACITFILFCAGVRARERKRGRDKKRECVCVCDRDLAGACCWYCLYPKVCVGVCMRESE